MKRRNFLTTLALGIVALPAAIKSLGAPRLKPVRELSLWVPLDNCITPAPEPDAIHLFKRSGVLIYEKMIPARNDILRFDLRPDEPPHLKSYMAYVTKVEGDRVYIKIVNPDKYDNGMLGVDLRITREPYRILYNAIPMNPDEAYSEKIN